MGIRKITFDNGDIILAKDQAILYYLLLKQQTKTLLPNGENIYKNSTGFLIQNESEKLQYTHKIIDNGVEFTFNPQLYLSICGHIIKLEKDTKYLFDWNDIENNENYYIVVRVDLSKETKIINNELKEFGNPVKLKLINTKESLTKDNLNQKPNDGIYEFPLISFIKKYNPDNSWEIKSKDENKYLLPLLMESNRNPPKLLTITQKIKEEKELLQEKQNQLKDVKNYLTNLEYRKMQELEELENLMKELIKIPKNKRPQIPENSNWKLILDYYSEFSDLSLNQININNMWYLSIIKKDDNNYYLKKFKNNHKNITGNHWNNGIAINHEWFRVPSIYRWELKIEPTELPKIDKGTGKILNLKVKNELISSFFTNLINFIM